MEEKMKTYPEFNKVETFWSKHKKEILFIVCGVVIYRIGYKSGFKHSMKAVDHYIQEATKALKIVNF